MAEEDVMFENFAMVRDSSETSVGVDARGWTLGVVVGQSQRRCEIRSL